MNITEKDIIIVVPIYRERFDKYEEMALTQLFDILRNYKICFVIPKGLQIKAVDGNAVEVFEKDYFLNVKTYNKLLLSREFYQRFKNYKYMFVYQLDAFIFEDKLLYFANQGYDYIGAPWLCGMYNIRSNDVKVAYVGNGGFSLRNINNTINLLNEKEQEITSVEYNEDFFFAENESENFAVAPINLALEFAFERQVRSCYEKNKYRLPMGCHAWQRYDSEFWRPIFKNIGYDICEVNGMEDSLNKELYDKNYLKSAFWENKVQIDEKRINKKSIFIYGAGKIGLHMLRLIESNNMIVEGFIDQKASTLLVDEKKIVTFDEFQNKDGNNFIVMICVAEKSKLELEKLLKMSGKEYIYYLDAIKRLDG